MSFANIYSQRVSIFSMFLRDEMMLHKMSGRMRRTNWKKTKETLRTWMKGVFFSLQNSIFLFLLRIWDLELRRQFIHLAFTSSPLFNLIWSDFLRGNFLSCCFVRVFFESSKDHAKEGCEYFVLPVLVLSLSSCTDTKLLTQKHDIRREY